MSDLLETKVSRGEFLDLILDDMTSELEAQRDAIKKRADAVPSVSVKPFLPLIPKDAEVSVYDRGGRYGTQITITFSINKAELPAQYVERGKQLAALEKEAEPIKERLWKLQNGKARARIELIRRSLEATGEGRKLLEEAASLKLRLSRKLLMEPKP